MFVFINQNITLYNFPVNIKIPTEINAIAENTFMIFIGTNFVNKTPSVTPNMVTIAKAIIDPMNTLKGLFVLLVIMIATIVIMIATNCVLSPSSARNIDVKVAMRIFQSMITPFV
jgi:hypothetical protein